MTRAQKLKIIAEELSAADGLPENAAAIIADLAADKNLGPAFEAILRATARIEEGSKQ